MVRPNGSDKKRMDRIERLWIEDRERWRKNDERWEKLGQYLRKCEVERKEHNDRLDAMLKRHDERFQKNDERFQKHEIENKKRDERIEAMLKILSRMMEAKR